MSVKTYTREQFRKDLQRTMPGFKWTVHKPSSLLIWDEAAKLHANATLAEVDALHMDATGTKSAGMNRIATLDATYRASDGYPFNVAVFGHGCRAPKIMDGSGKTLPQAFRDARNKCEAKEQFFGNGVRILAYGRVERAES